MPRVALPRLLDPATGGRRDLEVTADTVGELVGGLLEEIPQLEVHLFDHQGQLRPHVLCFIDGEPTRLEDRRASVGSSAEVRFLQAVSGGRFREPEPPTPPGSVG